MECDGKNPQSNQGLLQIGVDKEIGLGFDVNSAVSKTRVEKNQTMDVEKSVNKRSAEIKIELDSDDDETIRSMFRIKSRRNPKKVKVESDGGVDNVKKVEPNGSEDQELGGMDDTLATFRKKLKCPKESRVSTTKGIDSDANVKNTDVTSESKTLVIEPILSKDGIDESAKKVSKSSGKEKSKKLVKKKANKEVGSELKASKNNGKEKKKRSKSDSAKKKTTGQNLTQNNHDLSLDDHLEDSLSAFLLKAQSASLQKSKKISQVKQTNTGQACSGAVDQKPDYPMTVEIRDNERLTEHPGKTYIHNDVFYIEVNEEKMDPACTVGESAPIAGLISIPTPATDQKDSSSVLVQKKTLDQGSNPVGGVRLDQTQNGSRSDCDSPNQDIASVASQKENASTSDGRLSPISLGEFNKSADENEAYASETGSMIDPETKSDKKSAGKRIVRHAKRHRHDDMAYEGDADWETLVHEQNFLVNHQDGGEKGQSVKPKGKLDFLQTVSVDAAAAVSVGLKARAAGPVEKMKFKELLKRKGGLQEYIECRNHILHLWNKDVTRILPLSECGISDIAVADEHPQASLVRDIYSFLDRYSYINFGVASQKEISGGSVKANLEDLSLECWCDLEVLDDALQEYLVTIE